MSKSEFLFQTLKLGQLKEVLNFMNTHFVPLEAVSRGVHATAEDLNPFHEVLLKNLLKSGMSVGAFHESTGAMAGICLNTLAGRSDTGHFEVLEKNERAQTVLSILSQIEKEVNIFKEKKVDKAVNLFVISVDKKFSGKRLSYKLIEESEAIGKREGCPLIFAIATGLGSQHILSKCGFETLKMFNYEDIKINGKSPFDISAMMGAKSAFFVSKKL